MTLQKNLLNRGNESFIWRKFKECVHNGGANSSVQAGRGERKGRGFVRVFVLKGHCHANFAIFWSKPLKYLTKSLFFNKKLLIQYWEESTKVFLSEEQTIVIF